MFDEGQRLPSPYHRTKFESERIVREQPYVPWRVYRPGIVVGDSQDRRDGQDRRPLLLLQGDPARAPAACPSGSRSSGSTSATRTSCRSTGWRARSSTSPTSRTSTARPSTSPTRARSASTDLLNELAEAAHAPRFAVSIDKRLIDAAAEVAARRWPPRCRRSSRSPTSRCASSASRARCSAHMELVPRFDTHETGARARGLAARAAAAAARVRAAAVGLLGARDGARAPARGRTLREALERQARR